MPGRVKRPVADRLDAADLISGTADFADDELPDGVLVMGCVVAAGELRGVLATVAEADEALRRLAGVHVVQQLLGENLADPVGGGAHVPDRVRIRRGLVTGSAWFCPNATQVRSRNSLQFGQRVGIAGILPEWSAPPPTRRIVYCQPVAGSPTGDSSSPAPGRSTRGVNRNW